MTDTTASTKSGINWSKFLEVYGIILVVIVMMLALAAIKPEVFLSAQNLSNILKQNASLALLALGMYVVIVTAGIDLSVGSIMGLSMVSLAVASKAGVPWPVVLLIGPAIGLIVGWVNGVGLTVLKLPHPFIMTLATLSICRGLALELAIGHTTMRGMPEAIVTIGGGTTLGIPNSFVVVMAVAILALVTTKAMVWGRWIYAVGGEPQAAREMGIPTKAVLVSVYVISGLCAGIGAVVLAGRTAASSPLYGNLLELDTIAAVIIGGASFLGGRGHIGHALVGALMIGVIRNALNLLNVDVFFQMIAIGLIILLAVEADVLRNRLEARARTLQAARAP